MSGSAGVTERLLAAAVDVFAESGFEAARVAEIARRAGLTTGAIYARWPGKRELIIDAVRHILLRSMHDMHASAIGAGTPADEVLAALGSDLASARSVRVQNVMLEALVSARRDDTFRTAVTDAMRREAAGLTTVISRGKAEGSIDPELSTGAIVALCQSLGLGMHLAGSCEPESGRLEAAAWNALVARLMAALRPLQD